MAFTVNGHVCLLYTIKPFVEESELFSGFKQLQIAEKLFSPGNTERMHRALRREKGSHSAIKIQERA